MVRKPGEELTEAEVVEFSKGHLASFKKPKVCGLRGRPAPQRDGESAENGAEGAVQQVREILEGRFSRECNALSRDLRGVLPMFENVT